MLDAGAAVDGESEGERERDCPAMQTSVQVLLVLVIVLIIIPVEGGLFTAHSLYFFLHVLEVSLDAPFPGGGMFFCVYFVFVCVLQAHTRAAARKDDDMPDALAPGISTWHKIIEHYMRCFISIISSTSTGFILSQDGQRSKAITK